jgi:hypothetical protein
MICDNERNGTMTTDEAAKWRKIAEERLAKLNAIAQIGAEPPNAVVSIITEGEPDPTAGSADTSTWNYHSVTEFRQQLVRAAEAWNKKKEEYFRQVQQPAAETPRAALDAYAGTMMAGSYAYTLAAILGQAEREFGPQIARRLASAADEILTDGDFDDMNADVRQGVPLPPPSPAEQQQAGQMSVYDVLAGAGESEAA